MKELNAYLVERIRRSPTVESFRFEPEERIDFLPGQFLRVILDTKNKENPLLNKYLSFSSSPTKDYFEITKRLSQSEFSQGLNGLKIGQKILVKAPLGNCVFKEDYKRVIFLVGGIGITPVISIIEYIMDKKLETEAFLFYANRRKEDIAFKQELDSWQKINPKLKVNYVLGDQPSEDKTCISGTINKDLILQNVPEPKNAIFFSFGPPAMVEAMQGICKDLGCPRQSIKTENFLGY